MINLLTKFEMSSALEDFVFENAATITNLDQDMVEFALSKGGARAITLLNKLIANKLSETMAVAALVEENVALKARLQAIESAPVQQASASVQAAEKPSKTYRHKEDGNYKGIQQQIDPGTESPIKEGQLVILDESKLVDPATREVLLDLNNSPGHDNKSLLNNLLMKGCAFTVSNVHVKNSKDGRAFLKMDLTLQKQMEKPAKKKATEAGPKKPAKKLQVGVQEAQEKPEPVSVGGWD